MRDFSNNLRVVKKLTNKIEDRYKGLIIFMETLIWMK
jgi:hypothetical protein